MEGGLIEGICQKEPGQEEDGGEDKLAVGP